MDNEKFAKDLAALIDRHYGKKETPEGPTLQEKKVAAVESAIGVHERNINTLADIVAAMAGMVKVPHNLAKIGIQAILNDTEPEPEEVKK